MILVMPDNQSRRAAADDARVRRRARPRRRRQAAWRARATSPSRCAPKARASILDQFANPGQSARALPRHRPGDLARHATGAITHFVSAMGTTGTIMGVSRFLKEKNPAIAIIGAQPAEGSQIPGIRKWPEAYLPKIFDRARVDRIEPVSQADAEEIDAPARARGRHLRRHLVGRRVRGRAAHRARGARRDDRVRRLRSRRPLPVDRRVPRLSACDRARMTPILVFDIETVPDVAGMRRSRHAGASCRDAAVLDWFAQQRRAPTGSDFAPHLPAAGRRHRLRAARRGGDLRVWSVGEPEDPEPELIRRFFDGIEQATRRSSCRGTAAASTCRCCNHRALIHGVAAARYWDWGDDDREFKFNNYLGALPHAAPRPDGRARDVPAARERRARRDGAAVRISRQARHGRQRGRRRRRARASSTRSAATARPT